MSRPCGEGRCGRGGSVVHMTLNRGRGAIAPISTLIGWSRGRVSKPVTAILAATSARSLTRMFVCALIFRMVVEKPFPRRFSKRFEMLWSRGTWWW